MRGKGIKNGTSETDNIYAALQAKNIEVLYDDRDEKRAGEKIVDADLLGMSWRMVVSEKTIEKGGVELKQRFAKEGIVMELGKAILWVTQWNKPEKS